jgi:hypothetical protein
MATVLSFLGKQPVLKAIGMIFLPPRYLAYQKIPKSY